MITSVSHHISDRLIEMSEELASTLASIQDLIVASVEPSRLHTWEDVTHEFMTQFASSASIDVSRCELEATRQRPDETVSSFVSR